MWGKAGAAAPEEQRLGAIDAVRGVALCGILLINIVAMGQALEHEQPLRPPPAVDWEIWKAQTVWVAGAMRGLFSMLFGGSFLLFMAKADRGAEPAEVRRLFLRRLFWLFVFGAIDSTLLLWPGDVLVIYAPAGLILLPIWRWGPRRLLALAAVLVLAVSAGSVLRGADRLQAAVHGPALQAAAAGGAHISAAQSKVLKRWNRMLEPSHVEPKDRAKEQKARLGGYGANLAYMTDATVRWTLDYWATLWWIGDAAAFFVLGMALFRAGILQGDAPPWLYLALALAGYGLGVPLRLWQTGLEWRAALGGFAPEPWQVWAPAFLGQTSRAAMTLGHLGVLHLLWRAAPALFAPFKALGRMALSGYLGQSVLAAIVFSGFGLGLWGRLGWPGLLAVAASIWVIELAAASAWLVAFRMGPCEWLWRTLTYGRPPALLKRRPQLARASA